MLTFKLNSILALEAFVSAAKELPQEDVHDVVEGYIKISVECAEIFQLLSGEKRPESEVWLFLTWLGEEKEKLMLVLSLSLTKRNVM